MALALQYSQPVQSRYSAPGPATAKCWSNPSLHEEFSDLIEWRDRMYALKGHWSINSQVLV